ncbi:hypothetical protein HY572_01870 [Candidatus Micrarchaeota archaeon]|nr:hypothetical protein [Candidatus Micrarchaeota archaeon]
MFEFDLSDALRQTLEELKQRDKKLAEALTRKIREIVSRDVQTIDYYKNLRTPLQESKRVHVGRFVLIFKVYKEKNFILFQRFEHHDKAYQL